MQENQACGRCPPERHLGDAEDPQTAQMADSQTGSERLQMRDAICVDMIRA